MNQFLVLRIADPYSWVITGADGGRLGPVATGNLADAAAIARERQVVVIAPGSSVTLARPELPVRSGAKLAQVVPYAMEESLAGEVENFHFAIGATAEDGSTQVAAIRREELRSWVDVLAAAGIEPQAIVPDTLCLPDNPGKIVAVIDSGLLLVRVPGSLPVALDAEPITESFTLAGLEGEDRHVQLFVSQHDWQHSREMIEALREVTGSLDLQILPDGALPLLASAAVRPGTLSLMQGEFMRRTGWRAEWQRWRVAAILAVAALALHLGVRGYDLVRLHGEERRLDAAIEQAARIALPGAERIEDARAQVEQRLRGAGSGNPTGLLAQLAAVGGALAGAPGPKLESLGWREGALELQVVAPNTDAIARFAQGVNARGLKADVASTTSSEDGIEARVLIAAGGAS
jgi:general secretion pathway protein L